MRFALSLLAVATVAAAPLAAQDMMKMDHKEPPADIKPLQDMYYGWIVTAAEQTPQAEWDIKPTPEVRSIGQIFGHVANANFMFCAGAKGEDSPNTTDYEKGSRADIIAGLKAAKTYCDGVFEWANAHPHDERTFFGQKGSVTWVLAFNLAHTSEHYGNIVTYMRLQGHVPPSSQGGM
jgi:uncharacterized damage-inducible protein DinB